MSQFRVARLPFLRALFGLVILGPGVGSGASAQSVAAPRTVSFRTTFVGVGQDASRIWQGPAAGDVRGRVTLALQQMESAADGANPVWHVRTRWTVEAGSGTRSFVAELEGMVDWRAGTARLSGPVTSGWLEGAWVQMDGHLVDGDVSGVLRVLPSLAKR